MFLVVETILLVWNLALHCIFLNLSDRIMPQFCRKHVAVINWIRLHCIRRFLCSPWLFIWKVCADLSVFSLQNLFMTTCSWCGNLSGLRGIAHRNTLFFLSPLLCFSFTGNTPFYTELSGSETEGDNDRAVLNLVSKIICVCFGFALHLSFLEWSATICSVCTVLISYLTLLLTFLEFLPSYSH